MGRFYEQEGFKVNLVYIAGFFDGEGCISGQKQGDKPPTVRITIGQKKSEILYWIRKTLGMGRVITSPFRGTSRWIITSKENIGRFISLILPYCKIKKEELIVGQRLNNLVGPIGSNSISKDNLQKRLILCERLKLLKRG